MQNYSTKHIKSENNNLTVMFCLPYSLIAFIGYNCYSHETKKPTSSSSSLPLAQLFEVNVVIHICYFFPIECCFKRLNIFFVNYFNNFYPHNLRATDFNACSSDTNFINLPMSTFSIRYCTCPGRQTYFQYLILIDIALHFLQ